MKVTRNTSDRKQPFQRQKPEKPIASAEGPPIREN